MGIDGAGDVGLTIRLVTKGRVVEPKAAIDDRPVGIAQVWGQFFGRNEDGVGHRISFW